MVTGQNIRLDVHNLNASSVDVNIEDGMVRLYNLQVDPGTKEEPSIDVAAGQGDIFVAPSRAAFSHANLEWSSPCAFVCLPSGSVENQETTLLSLLSRICSRTEWVASSRLLRSKGGRSNPSVTSRCSSLLLWFSVDGRFSDDVIAFEGIMWTRLSALTLPRIVRLATIPMLEFADVEDGLAAHTMPASILAQPPRR